MRKLSYLFLVVLSLYTASAYTAPAASAEKSDYDKVCGYFTQLQDKLKHGSLSGEQRETFISKLVNQELKPGSPARQLWENCLLMPKQQRYEVYKGGVKEMAQDKAWQCQAMKTLFPTIEHH